MLILVLDNGTYIVKNLKDFECCLVSHFVEKIAETVINSTWHCCKAEKVIKFSANKCKARYYYLELCLGVCNLLLHPKYSKFSVMKQPTKLGVLVDNVK